MRAPERGFTLIELIVGIVLLAVALTGILGLLINQAPQAVDPVQQVRAAQLAQRLSGEILQKSFDENSDHNGGRYRCGEQVAGVTISPCSSSYGPDGSGESVTYAYNDVDDFDTGGSWKDASIYTQTGAVIANDEYRNYQIKLPSARSISVMGPSKTPVNLPARLASVSTYKCVCRIRACSTSPSIGGTTDGSLRCRVLPACPNVRACNRFQRPITSTG